MEFKVYKLSDEWFDSSISTGTSVVALKKIPEPNTFATKDDAIERCKDVDGRTTILEVY